MGVLPDLTNDTPVLSVIFQSEDWSLIIDWGYLHQGASELASLYKDDQNV